MLLEPSVKRPILAVAFDMDGLLLNTEDLYEELGNELMLRRGKSFRDVTRQKMMGLPAAKAYQVLIHEEGLEENWQDLQREADALFMTMLQSRVKVMSGVIELLDRIDELKLPRCVATSSRRTLAITALTTAGILDRFDFIITAEEVMHGKPAPDIYQEAARRMEVAVERMLVLEDSAIGTQAGVAANAYVISVPNKHTIGSNFQGAKAIVQEGLKSRILLDLF